MEVSVLPHPSRYREPVIIHALEKGDPSLAGTFAGGCSMHGPDGGHWEAICPQEPEAQGEGQKPKAAVGNGVAFGQPENRGP